LLSSQSRHSILDEKIDLYFRGGAELVIVIDPEGRCVELHEAGSRNLFAPGEHARSRMFPDLAIDVSELFVDLF